jgi:xanthosine utilization system XapX-like protein
MKKNYSLFLGILIFLNGCALFSPSTNQNTKNQDKIAKVVQKTETTKEELAKGDQEKLTQTATFAYGVNYSLNQVTNVTPPIATALKLNGRIMSIVGSPQLDEMNKIVQIVDLLNSEVLKEKLKGQKLLSNKDDEVKELQAANNELKTKYEHQIGDLITKSKDIARNGDNAQATVNEMGGNFGLNAVWWGLKRFVFTSLTAILIFVVVFLFLRIASATNPIAAAVFSVFNVIGSGILQLIKGLTPKAVQISNLVHLDEYNKYKQTLDKVVDTIETFKLKCEAGNKQCTLGEVLEELDRVMDQKDKDCVKDILKDQKWV